MTTTKVISNCGTQIYRLILAALANNSVCSFSNIPGFVTLLLNNFTNNSVKYNGSVNWSTESNKVYWHDILVLIEALEFTVMYQNIYIYLW